MPMIIGIDIDNVLNNLVEESLITYNNESKHGLTIDDIHHYNMKNFLLPEYRDRWIYYFTCECTWINIKPRDGSYEALKSFVDQGHRVVYVTATWPTNIPVKEKWLKETYPFIDTLSNLIMVQDKQLIKMDVLIDDYAENLVDKVDSMGNNISSDYLKVCFAYPWNTYFVPNGVDSFRFKDWDEIKKFILEGDFKK